MRGIRVEKPEHSAMVHELAATRSMVKVMLRLPRQSIAKPCASGNWPDAAIRPTPAQSSMRSDRYTLNRSDF
jgi:hypothetical protein